MTDDGGGRPRDEPVVTEEQAWAKWQEIAGYVESMVQRSDTPGAWTPSASSSLAGDDMVTDPYQVSHAFAHCMTAAIDHLHAVTNLVVDHQLLHIAAPASLARGFIENVATAFWLLHPTKRSERVARTMRWHAKNAHERATAMRELFGDRPAPGSSKAEQVRRMVDIARKVNADDADGVEFGYRPSDAVSYSNLHAGLPGMGVLFAWRLCSGFAHGRPWAYLGVLEQQTLPTDAPGVLDMRLTNDLARSLYPVLTGMHLAEAALRLHQQRAQPLYG